MVIPGIDSSKLRISHRKGTSDAHIAIPSPQAVHCLVDPLPFVSFHVILIERQLDACSDLHQPTPTDADASDGFIPLIVGLEQFEGCLSDLRAGTGGCPQFSLP